MPTRTSRDDGQAYYPQAGERGWNWEFVCELGIPNVGARVPMPGLTNCFLFAGVAVLASLTFANFLLEPSTGATFVSAPLKPAVTAEHEPRPALIERRRSEQFAPKIIETDELPESELTPSEGSVASSEADLTGTSAASTQAAPHLRVAPVALSSAKALRDSAAPGASKIAKRNFKAERDRNRRAAQYRTRTRLPPQMFADRPRQQGTFAGQQGGFSAYAPRESFGRFGWGNGW
jgi:hypothetical protein